MSKIIQGKFRILDNKKVKADYFRMTIEAPEIAREAQPGQFVHLRCANSLEPLLRRPFSFHRINKDDFEILYKVIGQGTNLLAKKQKNDTIDVLGPLGNGFPLLPTADSQLRTVILVAGGMGVAPLLALAEELVKGKRESRLLVLLGAKNKTQLLCVRDFQNLGAKVQIATDNGSLGFKGFVTELLKKLLTIGYSRTTIFACGPRPMLQELTRISCKTKIPACASLEENLACGLGACLGCAVKTKKGYQRVCKDGPVFSLKEIIWERR